VASATTKTIVTTIDEESNEPSSKYACADRHRTTITPCWCSTHGGMSGGGCEKRRERTDLRPHLAFRLLALYRHVLRIRVSTTTNERGETNSNDKRQSWYYAGVESTPRPQPIPSASLFLSWSWSPAWSLWSREVEGGSGVGAPRVGDVATCSPDPGPGRIQARRPGRTYYAVLQRPPCGYLDRRQLTAAGCGRDRACRARRTRELAAVDGRSVTGAPRRR
jgi:hypothetical protein